MDDKQILCSLDDIKMSDERKKIVLDNILAQADILETSQKSKRTNRKHYIWKYSLTMAIFFVFILSIKILYPFIKDILNDTNTTKIASTYTASPKITDTTDTLRLTTRDRIIKKKEYGVVSLSHPTTAEKNTLIQRAEIPNDTAQGVNFYEDEKYTYLFYDDGTVAGIYATYLNDPTYTPNPGWSKKELSEEEAVLLAQKALEKYCDSYTAETKNRFVPKITISKSEDDDSLHYPEWRITFQEFTESGICRNTLDVAIDIYGYVAEVSFGIRSNVSDSELMSKEYISKDDAISLALIQFEKEKIDIDMKQFKVSATLFERKGSVLWELCFEELDKNGEQKAYKRSYWMILDAISGKWISTDKGR